MKPIVESGSYRPQPGFAVHLPTSAPDKNEIKANCSDYNKVLERLEDWVETEGLKYGLELKKGDER